MACVCVCVWCMVCVVGWVGAVCVCVCVHVLPGREHEGGFAQGSETGLVRPQVVQEAAVAAHIQDELLHGALHSHRLFTEGRVVG